MAIRRWAAILAVATGLACADRKNGAGEEESKATGGQPRREQASEGAGVPPGERAGGAPAQTGGRTGGAAVVGSAGRHASPGDVPVDGGSPRVDPPTGTTVPFVGHVRSIGPKWIVVQMSPTTLGEATIVDETDFARGGEAIPRSEVSPGAKVRVAWELHEGSRVATRIELLDEPRAGPRTTPGE